MNSSALQRTRPAPAGYLRPTLAPARLRVVSRRENASTGVRWLLVFVVAVVAVLGLNLYINTQLVQLSYSIRQAQSELVTITDDSRALEQEIQELSAPENLRKAAIDKGMVPVAPNGFINLSAGTVDGGTPAR